MGDDVFDACDEVEQWQGGKEHHSVTWGCQEISWQAEHAMWAYHATGNAGSIVRSAALLVHSQACEWVGVSQRTAGLKRQRAHPRNHLVNLD